MSQVKKQIMWIALIITVIIAGCMWQTSRDINTTTEQPIEANEPIIGYVVTLGTRPSPVRAAPTAVAATISPTAAQDKPEPTPIPLYTQDDIHMLARLIWNEARGCNTAAQAAVGWTVLNRLADPRFPSTVAEIVTAKSQFAYSPDAPLTVELTALAGDVLERWAREQAGEQDVGRTLPKGYLFFDGDGKCNWFRMEYYDTEYWDWSLPDVYGTEVK